MKKKLPILFLLVLFSSVHYMMHAGTSKKDSLLMVYKSASDTEKVNILNNLSRLLLGIEDDEAGKFANEAFEIAKKINFKTGISNSLNSIGNHYYYINDYEKAINYYKKSIEHSDFLGNKYLIAISNLRLGEVYLFKEDYEMAIKYYDKSIAEFEKNNDKKNLKDAINNKAIAYYYMGNYEKALEFYLTVLRIKEENGYRKEMTETLMGIGNVYVNKTNYDEALKYYNQGLKISEELNNKGDISTCLNNIGNVYMQMKDNQKALTYLTQSVKIKEELANKNSLYKGSLITSLMNIGVVYSKLGDSSKAFIYYPKALEYLNQALKISNELGAKQGIASCLINIGVLYGKQSDFEKGITNILQGIEIAREINNKDFIKSGYEELASIYSETGEYKKAYDYHKQYTDLKDTLLNEANSKAIAEMQTKYETNKKELEIKDLTKDRELQNEKQQKERAIFMAIGGMVLIIVLFVLYGYIAKQKANKALEEKNIAINKQKEQIELQKEIVEHKNKEITDSITYAKKIQEAILPSTKFVRELMPDSFVFYQPKDIVSGDFYWFSKKGNKILFAAADCTGHGVPGALMSMIGSNLLNEIVNDKNISEPGEILNQLHIGVRKSLKQDAADTESRDGMDIALCSFDSATHALEYAGANRSLYLIRNKSLEVTKANKMPIGGLQAEGEERKFTNHSFQVDKEDMIYLCSDGYADQFGGKDGKKFMEKNFKDLLLKTFMIPVEQQKELFKRTINDWRGNLEQIDDILLIGARITW